MMNLNTELMGNLIFVLVGYTTAGFGIYGLSGSLMAAICLPISYLCYSILKKNNGF